MRLADLVAAAQTCVTQSVAQGRPYPQQLYLGEFGFRQHDNVTLNFVRDLLRLTTRITQQKRMRPTSTSTTISPAEALDILPASGVTSNHDWLWSVFKYSYNASQRGPTTVGDDLGVGIWASARHFEFRSRPRRLADWRAGCGESCYSNARQG